MTTFRWAERLLANRATRAPHPIVTPDGPRDAEAYVEELRRILSRFGSSRALPKGALLFDPGDRSRHLYIVRSGTIDVTLPDDDARRPLATFRPGATFLFDFGGHQVASLEAGEDSEVLDIPFARLTRLARQEMDLRLLLRQCHAFDLKSFLDVCYPARSRFRLVQAREGGEGPPRPREAAEPSPARQPGAQFLIPFHEDAGSHSAARKRRATNHSRRAERTEGPWR